MQEKKKVLIACNYFSIHTKSLLLNLYSSGIDVELLCSDYNINLIKVDELLPIKKHIYSSNFNFKNKIIFHFFLQFTILKKICKHTINIRLCRTTLPWN